MDIWRCSVCSKTKDISGPHLDGKKTVRSDCWPCGKKQTYVRESLTASRGVAQVVTAPFLFNPTATFAWEKSHLTTTSGSVGTTKELPSNPFVSLVAPSSKSLFINTSDTHTNSMNSGNPFLAAASATTTISQRKAETLTPLKPLSSSGNVSPIVMHSASATDRPRQSPPFMFTAAPTTLTTSIINHTSSVDIGDSNVPKWVCSVCKKVKDLSGNHLKGKTSVRSDCWPCGLKRKFILLTSEARGPSEAPMTLPCSMTTKAGLSSPHDTGKNDVVVSAENSPTPSKTALWKNPLIPESDTENNIYLQVSVTQQKRQQSVTREKDPSLLTVPLKSENPDAIMSPLFSTFEGEVLRGYRRQLVDGIRTRTAWHNRTLYVLTPEKSGGKNFGSPGASDLGKVAVVFLAVEHKLAQSPFRLMRRLFCPDEFIFAAACMYANTFLAGHQTSPRQSSFIVYGPQVDRTVPITPCSSIIKGCAYAQQRVVSGEKRVEGAQSIFSNTGWLTLPSHATAEAIRLTVVQEEEEQQQQHDNDYNNEQADAESLGIDVILVAETMKLNELSQAAALALPVKPF